MHSIPVMSRRFMPTPAAREVQRTPRRDFAQAVRNAQASPQALPLTHLTDGYHLRSITEGGHLEPSQCHVFGEPLLYFFYGRPAYRVAANLPSNGFEAYWPICFLMRPAAVSTKRIYPFDSGAFHTGRFGNFFHRDMIKEDFELDVDPTMPARLLNLFWPDAKSYFDNRGALAPDFNVIDFELKSYAEIIRAKSNEGFDERNSAIELQTDVPVPLEGNILAVILPIDFADQKTRAHFEKLGALVLPFNTVGRQGATEMVGQIYDLCRDLYDGKHGLGPLW